MGWGNAARTHSDHFGVEDVPPRSDSGVTDEFVIPTLVADEEHPPVPIQPGDEIVFFNFRSDRARQLTEALACDEFAGFERPGSVVGDVQVTTLTRYEAGLPVTVAFEPHDVVNPLARVISDAGLLQFHCAETEKYAHVPYFFNGGTEHEFPHEKRLLVPSPKVATYDLAPEMSAFKITDKLLRAIEERETDVFIVNFANPDMVGHTGKLDKTIEACQYVDT